MKSEPKTVTLDNNDRAYLGTLVKRELEVVTKRYNTAIDKCIRDSNHKCMVRLQNIYDMLCE